MELELSEDQIQTTNYPIHSNIPLIYTDISENKEQITNILLIDSSVKDYQVFVDSVNKSTFVIVYSVMSSKTELLNLLRNNFTNISRIGLAFDVYTDGTTKMFLDMKPLFNDNEIEPFSESTQFMIELLKEFNVKNIDYLGCNTLNYTNWVDYYTIISENTGVIVGASNDKTGNIKYGGDWIMESTSEDIEYIYFTNSITYYKYILATITIIIGGINYTLDTTTKTATVISNNPIYSGNIIIPASVSYNNEDYSVTSIGNSSFQRCTGLTSITIPNSVASIGYFAFFNCTSLTSFTIPNLVTLIEDCTFFGCSSLTSVTIPNSVTSIGTDSFYNCTSLTNVTIPNSVTSIGYESFKECSNLTNVTIPNSVTSILQYAFFRCTSLVSVIIPSSVTSLGYAAFYECTSLTNVYIVSVTSISQYAFSGCTSLTNVYFYSITVLPSMVYPFTNIQNVTAYYNVGVKTPSNSSSLAEITSYLRSVGFTSVIANKANPTISDFSIPAKTYGSSPFQITTPTSNSNGVFTYSSSNQSVATISGTTITIVGTGSTTITASQAATENYNSGTIQASFQVNNPSPTISDFSIPAKTFGSSPFPIPQPISNSNGIFSYSSSNQSVATILGNIITIVGAGSTTITASQAATDNYNSGFITASFQVNKANPTISSFSILPKTFGSSPFPITPPTSNSGGAFSYTSSIPSVATILGNIKTIVGTGSTTITASQAATDNYNSGFITASFQVNKANPTISDFSIPAKIFGSSPFQITPPTSNSNGVFTYSSSTPSVATILGNIITIVGAGSTTITASQAATDNYNSGFITASFQVNKANPTISDFSIPAKIFGSSPFQITPPTSNSNGVFTYSSSNSSVATISGNIITIVSVGNTIITASQEATDNYNSGSIQASFEVNESTASNPVSINNKEDFEYCMLTKSSFVELNNSIEIDIKLESEYKKKLSSNGIILITKKNN
jgi:uncharacterized protein YjdB